MKLAGAIKPYTSTWPGAFGYLNPSQYALGRIRSRYRASMRRR